MPLDKDEAHNRGAFIHGPMLNLYRCWEERRRNGTKAEHLEETCKAQIPQSKYAFVCCQAAHHSASTDQSLQFHRV